MTDSKKGLQRTFAPNSICFGCGPANSHGLQIDSIAEGEVVTCHWTPKKEHEAFPGMLSGGIIGTLLDCHSNWTAAFFLMKARGDKTPPCTVTAEYHVTLKRPTSSGSPVELKARVVESNTDRAVVEAELISQGKISATCRGTFVAVKEGHPAYHRWN